MQRSENQTYIYCKQLWLNKITGRKSHRTFLPTKYWISPTRIYNFFSGKGKQNRALSFSSQTEKAYSTFWTEYDAAIDR